MPTPTSNDETRQPAQPQNAEVEKLYESCCGSCASPSPTNSGMTLEDLTSVTNGADSRRQSGTP